jgi:hypothetical protein
VLELLHHVDTAQGQLLNQEHAHKLHAHKATLYVRQLSPTEISEKALSYSTHAPTDNIINITQTAVTRPYVDPTYMAILSELSESHSGENQEFQKVVFLFINSMETLLQHKESALSFVLNTLLHAKYNILTDLPTLATMSSSQRARETGEHPHSVLCQQC